MAFASIQFNAASPGTSVLGLSNSASVTLTDAGGAGADSYQWEFLQVPGPVAAYPTITNETSQVATVAAPGGEFVDGLYVVRLTRNDPVDGVSIDTRFFGIADADGLHLPVAGVNRGMSNVGASSEAEKAGWMGSVLGGTHTMLDAFLRLRRDREEYTYVVGSGGSEPYVPTLSGKNHQILTLTGSTQTVNLPAATDGAKITIVDGQGSAHVLPITINTFAGDTLEGGTSTTLNRPFESITLYGVAGTGWVRLYADGAPGATDYFIVSSAEGGWSGRTAPQFYFASSIANGGNSSDSITLENGKSYRVQIQVTATQVDGTVHVFDAFLRCYASGGVITFLDDPGGTKLVELGSGNSTEVTVSVTTSGLSLQFLTANATGENVNAVRYIGHEEMATPTAPLS